MVLNSPSFLAFVVISATIVDTILSRSLEEEKSEIRSTFGFTNDVEGHLYVWLYTTVCKVFMYELNPQVKKRWESKALMMMNMS